MLRFPVEWNFNSRDLFYSQAHLELNGEWTLSTKWKSLFGSNMYEVDFIEIHRKTHCDIISICGTLSLRGFNRKVSTQAFSKLLKLGSTSAKLIEQMTDITLHGSNSSSLYGVITITSISENYPIYPEKRAYKVCYQPKSLLQLSDDFKTLLDTQSNADVNLKCGNTSIPAHKLILSTRSPVFLAMFKTPMKETHKNEVDISDIDASVLQAMITYIYTGQTIDLTVSSASDLLFAADKYQLLDLKRMCCDYLKENISLMIVMKILVLGDLYAEELKTFGMDYVCKSYKNFSEFENIAEWKTLQTERPALAVEILASILKAKDPKK